MLQSRPPMASTGLLMLGSVRCRIPQQLHSGLILMNQNRLSERARQSLAALSPEKRARAEAALTCIQSPEYQESEHKDREALEREYRATGTIASTPVTESDLQAFEEFIRSLRQARESAGLSLDEVASRSGIDKAQLRRLENGKVHDPRSSTLARYARAIGKRLAWSLEDVQSRHTR
jgi:ribosome-binding protein aMBF1 (putative translation factor)